MYKIFYFILFYYLLATESIFEDSVFSFIVYVYRGKKTLKFTH